MPNTNRIFIEYVVFKTYAHPEIYKNIVNRFIRVLEEIKLKFGNFQVFLNLNTITVSAIERHKNIISMFTDTCIENKLLFSRYLEKCVIYNVPNIIEAVKVVLFPFIMPETRKLIEFYNKEQTDKIISA